MRKKGRTRNGKKKRNIIIIAALAVVFAAAGIFAGITYTDDSDAKEELKANEVEIVDESGDVKVVDKDSKEAEEYDKAVASGEREEVSEVKKSSSDVKKTNTGSNKNSASNTSNKNTSSSDKKNTSSSSSSSSKKDTGSSSSGSSASPSKHTHSWTAVYKEVDNGYYKTVPKREAYTCCNRCGADITGNIGPHMEAHALAGEKYASYRTEYRTVNTQEWVSNVEKVVDYYKCSCGATK